VYWPLTSQEILEIKFSSAYQNAALISNSNDLIFIIVRIIKRLLNSDPAHFFNKVMLIVSNLRATLENIDDFDNLGRESSIL